MDWTTLILQVLLTLASHVSYTPPNPMADKSENVMSTRYEILFAIYSPPIIRTGFWVLGIVEMISLLCTSRLSIPYLTSTHLHLTALSTLGCVCICAGALIRYQCYRALGKLFTFERSLKRDHALVTHGPYSIVRHPSYLGILLNTVGVALWNGSRGSWVRESGVLETLVGRVVLGAYFSVFAVVLVTLLWRMPKEDATLRAAFEKQWDEWARRVPYMILPGIL